MAILLDTSAWIEYFINSKNAKTVTEALNLGECNTSIISIAEVVNWALKKGQNSMPLVEGIEKLSNVVSIDTTIAQMAGELNFERKKRIKKWGMADSIILATAISYGLNIITKDSDFRGLPNTQIL